MGRGRGNGGLIALAAVGVGALVLFRSKPAAARSPTAPRSPVEKVLSPHFKLSEFLRSGSVPQLAGYEPSPAELANLQSLVDKVLEPLRQEFGAVLVTGGGRPQSVRNAAGKTITDSLLTSTDPVARTAALASDHIPFAAADIVLASNPTVEKHQAAYLWLINNQAVRQVILELKHDSTGALAIHHIHVAVVTPTRPRLPDATRAFAAIDGVPIPNASVSEAVANA